MCVCVCAYRILSPLDRYLGGQERDGGSVVEEEEEEKKRERYRLI